MTDRNGAAAGGRPGRNSVRIPLGISRENYTVIPLMGPSLTCEMIMFTRNGKIIRVEIQL